jgi:putative transposase
MCEPLQADVFRRTLRLKVRAEAYPWLDAAALAVNQVFNSAHATSAAADRNPRAKAQCLSGFDLCSRSAGASKFFERIGADTLWRICVEYVAKRRAARGVKLRWRVSCGSRRSLRWCRSRRQASV